MILNQMRDCVQRDIGQRGLARDPVDNLLTATEPDFAAACRSIADHPQPRIGIVTGFMIPSVEPPVGETDGPLGALFLAQVLDHLKIPCVLASDQAALSALRLGTAWLSLNARVCELDPTTGLWPADVGEVSHFIALERSGPCHDDGRNCTMRGRDITALTAPAHRFLELPHACVTIGIGDGGNEIGMGKIPRATIARNIPNGDRVACRTPTDYLMVAGISNWGAYALAAGLLYLRHIPACDLFNPERERELLRYLVATAPLVDGVTGQFTVSVDGLDFDTYIQPFRELATLLASSLVTVR